MKNTAALDALLNGYKIYSDAGIVALENLLASHPMPKSEAELIQLHQLLLFCMAYPGSQLVFERANLQMNVLVQTVIKKVKQNPYFLYNSGISGSLVCAQFGLWLNQYLIDEKLDTLYLESVEADASDLVAKLSYTLDDVEQELMGANVAYFADWQKAYYGKIKGKQAQLRYLIAASMQCAGSISYRENMFAAFQLFTTFSLDVSLCGLSLGRALKIPPYFHKKGLQKQTSLADVFALGNPQKMPITKAQKAHLVRVARGAMASLLRETDTFTYAQTHETSYFIMGEGISIALYYMVPEQKFSLQSYVGFMLFKNTLPMAYGGCWLLETQAAFGVNVLPPYRGGESAKVVAQILRLYQYQFKISQFTVDPYQIGKGNEEGIASGAFWFYYKLGFRPVDTSLQNIAKREFEKIQANASYRSNSAILLKLVEKDLTWQMPERNAKPIVLNQISNIVSMYISQHFEGNRKEAKNAAKLKVQKILAEPIANTSFFNRMLVLCDALGAFEKMQKKDLQKLVNAFQLKAKDEANAYLLMQSVQTFWKLLPR